MSRVSQISDWRKAGKLLRVSGPYIFASCLFLISQSQQVPDRQPDYLSRLHQEYVGRTQKDDELTAKIAATNRVLIDSVDDITNTMNFNAAISNLNAKGITDVVAYNELVKQLKEKYKIKDKPEEK